MGTVIRILSALLIASFFLIAGNGLQGTLLSVRGDIEGFSLLLIGTLMSAYYVGFIAGCHFAPRMVKRAGHIRTFTALASIASAAAIAYALAAEPIFWIGLRIITGFALAGLYMIIESWINETASNDNRGRILAVYRMVDLGALTIGQALLAAADPAAFTLFALVSILISLALVPVAMTTTSQPKPIANTELNLSKLFRISPLAASGCLSAGAANGAFWAVGAVYVQHIGYSVDTVAIFMASVVVAGAISQWPIGLLSDQIDRRLVIIAVAIACAASGILLAVTGTNSMQSLLIGGMCFGLSGMPIFGLSVAHANDRAEPHEYVTLAAGLLLLYGVGAVAGPLIATAVMSQFGAQTLFGHTSAIYVALALFGLFRLLVSDRPSRKQREDFVAVPRTSPMVFEIDPRGEDEEETSSPSAQS